MCLGWMVGDEALKNSGKSMRKLFAGRVGCVARSGPSGQAALQSGFATYQWCHSGGSGTFMECYQVPSLGSSAQT